jgi:probable rRNA maturation factor
MDDPPGDGIAVEISDTQRHLRADAAELARLVRNVLAGEGVRRAEVSLVLLDNSSIHELNRRHLGHDWPTDVIAFRLSEPADPVLSAEVVVSAEMAAATAREAGTDPLDELALYVVHGLLHLCGYDDQTADQRAAMRRREAEVLKREGRTDTFERVGPVPREGMSCRK